MISFKKFLNENSNQMATTSVVLGRLYWKAFRKIIEYTKFRGHDVKVIEGPGILDKKFDIRGPKFVLDVIVNEIKRWDTDDEE